MAGRTHTGVGGNKRRMVNGPRIAARALIQQRGNVLVSTYDTPNGIVHALPGGGQKRGETLDESLVREIREEAGLDVSVGRMRWIREFIPARLPDSSFDPAFHQVEIIFECTAPGDATPRLGDTPDPGQIGVGWLPVGDLVNAPFFPQEIARILNGQALDRPYLGDT